MRISRSDDTWWRTRDRVEVARDMVCSKTVHVSTVSVSDVGDRVSDGVDGRVGSVAVDQ